jgi:hypothetical protein
MAKGNIVIISSYSIPDPRFKTAWEFKTAHSTYSGTLLARNMSGFTWFQMD